MATKFSQNEEHKAQVNINEECKTSEKMSMAKAVDRISEIVKQNEEFMAKEFANAQEWQMRAQMTMTAFKEDVENKKKSHTVIDIPSTFSKEQKDALKEYATQMGGSYTSMKVVEQLSDGSEKISFPARIEFGKDAIYAPDVCAKMLLGEGKDNLIKDILESKAIHEQKQNILQDKEKKIGNRKENQKIATLRNGNLKL